MSGYLHRSTLRTALAALLLACCANTTFAATSTNGEPAAYGARDDAMRFADEVAARHAELDRAWVREQLQRARRVPAVQRLIMPAAAPSAKNWAAYRARFIERDRIAAGAAFWRQHADALARAEARWGVPAQVIVGVIGVETFYGRITGGFRVIDALATLSFDFPSGRRDSTPFFRS
jgi:membrane-bound lytic murein transglycosylase B